MIATYLEDPKLGEVSRRTVFVRTTASLGEPAELHDPLQPLRPPRLPGAAERPARRGAAEAQDGVELTPAQPASFGCPCHGGQYDTEGRRIAGPPVRAMDRSSSRSRTAGSCSAEPFSVGKVEGTGETRGSRSTATRPRRSTWTVSGAGCTRSRRLADGRSPPRASADRDRPSSTRSTGSRSARASSAGSSTSSSARFRDDINWMQTLGSATLTAFLVQAITGVILAMYYRPDPDERLRVDPAHHERRHARLARPRHAQAGAPASSSS